MKYKTQSLTKYLNDLSAKLAAPGGGSAAALNAGLGASLISMVVNFTLGKSKYITYQGQLKTISIKSNKLKNKFLNLVDEDCLAYQSQDPKKALAVPLTVARLSCQAIQLCPALVIKGNINLISDVAVAAVLLESAFTAACFNIEINLKSLGNKKLTKKVNQELGKMRRIVLKIRQETEARVGKIIRRPCGC